MNFLSEILQQVPSGTDAGKTLLLAAVLLGCLGLLGCLVRHLLRLEPRLQSSDSQLLRTRGESEAL